MTRHPFRTDWLIPAALILLALIPVLAGLTRLADLGTGSPTPETTRFHADPLPVVLHILSATWFALLGALQFSPPLRSTRWHRLSGRSLVPAGPGHTLPMLSHTRSLCPRSTQHPSVHSLFGRHGCPGCPACTHRPP